MTALPPERSGPREIAVFSLALVASTVSVLFLGDAGVLFTRPFWVDELLTVAVAGRGSPATVIGDLASGADGGASLFHLGVWALHAVGIPLVPPALRTMSLVCVLSALLLVYIVLRRRFGGVESAAGALAVGASTLVIAHAYEARFYGPWLLCCALVAWAFARRQERPASRGSAIALGTLSFALCTIHFYGIISLALMTAAVMASHGRRWREGLRLVAPAAAGLLSLLIVAPLALAQREAYTVPSWIPDFTTGQLTTSVREFWMATIPLAGAAAIVIASMVRSTPGAGTLARLTPGAGSAGIVSLAALALMPLALACLSIAGQPSMISRYAITATLAWGPWIALAAAMSGRWIARAAVALLLWFWFAGYVREARRQTDFHLAVAQARDAYEQARAFSQVLPIVFPSINVMYPLIASDPQRDARAVFLEIPDSTFRALFPDSTLLGQFNRGVVLERDLARVHSARFGFPRLMPQGTLDTTARFLLFAPTGRLPAGFSGQEQFAKVLFPHHQLRRLLPDLSVMERVSKPSSN